MSNNPLSAINTSFHNYILERKKAEKFHMDGNGLPDYAFALDYELRKKLDAIPNFYEISRKVAATYASRELQVINQEAIAVTPRQFSDVYSMGQDCAKILGIGIPNIYIKSSPVLNAYAYCTDDIEPLIVIHSALYERLTPGELKTVIGHECGHIHNMHGVYSIMAAILFEGASLVLAGGITRAMFNLVTYGAQFALNSWNRAKEVTSDRAGMICCDRLEDTYTAQAKLFYGAAFGNHEIDLDEIMKQLDMQKNNITGFLELTRTHPIAARRIMAEKYFADCEILYSWRPDLKQPGQTILSRERTDELCKTCISIIK